MKTNVILFLMLTSAMISSCTSTGYYITNNGVKYVHYNDGGTLKKIETKIDANPKTFRPIPKWESIYGKDESSVFRGHIKIKNADPKTFTPLNKEFSKDTKRVFYGSKCEIKRADNKTFTPINSYMAKDKHRVYEYIFYGDYSCKSALNIIPSTDTDSFKLLNRFYSKDKNEVFFNNTPILNADPFTFQISKGYGKDRFGKDSKYVYYEGKIIPKADVNSFLVLNSTFSKDKNHVYVRSLRKVQILKNADSATFTFGIGTCTLCAKDKNYCYDPRGKAIDCKSKQ